MDRTKGTNYNRDKENARKGGMVMGRKKKENTSRQMMQKEIFDNLQLNEAGRLKDSYDYIMDCQEEIAKMKNPERIFSRVMKQKLQELLTKDENGQPVKPKVEAYIEYIAECLTPGTSTLAMWNRGKVWQTPVIEHAGGTCEMDHDAVHKMWKKTVKEWWDEDSFPFLNDKSYLCDKRDVVLYFLLTMGFTAKESDAFLYEMCLVKDRDFVRPLYALDFKESLFRWFLQWNENHEKKISYEEACGHYLEYGDWLLKKVKPRMKALIEKIDCYVCGILEYDPESENAAEMCEAKANCENLLRKLPDDAKVLYTYEPAENLKRSMALMTHVERKLERKKAKANEKSEKRRDDSILAEYQYYNENTTVNRGTEFAWKELSRLADARQENFREGFEKFQDKSLDFISEAHWSQFSQLIRLFVISQASGQNAHLLVKTQMQKDNDEGVNERDEKKSTLAEREMHFREVEKAFENLRRTNISFTFDGWDIRNMLKRYTNTRGTMSALFKPIRRQDVNAPEIGKTSSSSGLSQMLNRYHKWCTGAAETADEIQKGPHAEFKRENVLKAALAAGIEDSEELQSKLQLAGSPSFQFLDPKEAIVYLMARYREEFLASYNNVDEIVRKLTKSKLNLPSKEKDYELLKSEIVMLPAELEIKLPKAWSSQDAVKVSSYSERERMTRILEEWWGNMINDHILPKDLSLVELIRMADFMTVLYSSSNGSEDELEKIRKTLFYGPYTDDFKVFENKKTKRIGVEEQKDWLRAIVELNRTMKQIFTEDGVKYLFSNAYGIPDTCSIDEVSDIVEDERERLGNTSNTEDYEYLAELYCESIQEELFDTVEEIDVEAFLKASNAEIQKHLNHFSEVIEACFFIRQEEPTVESRYFLEQWSLMLAALDFADVDVTEAQEVLNKYLNIWNRGIKRNQDRKTEKFRETKQKKSALR